MRPKTDFMGRFSAHRHRLRCPNCHGRATRVQRGVFDRACILAGANAERFRCRDKRCGWVALMRRGDSSWVPAGPWLAPLMRKLRPVFAAVAGVAVAAVAWSAWQRQQPAAPQYVDVGPRQVARGVSYDGDALPADHPILVKAAFHVEQPPAPAPEPTLHTQHSTTVPLALRRHCSWGQPGRSPYRGSVEQALISAYVPADVVRLVAADIAARRSVDRVRITNDAIVAERSGRKFDHRHVAMTYGLTLCVDTRVNFKARHVERADLYEARAADGRQFSVMVPDVCGNVSVLAETSAADAGGGDGVSDGVGGGVGGGSVTSGLPDELVYRDGREDTAERGPEVQLVPAPGTLACAALGLALAVALTRRRNAARR